MSEVFALAGYGLTQSYQSCRVLDEVSFELKSGEAMAVIGPNGAGKSTLLKIAAGLLVDDQPKIQYRGQPFMALSPIERAQRVFYVASDFSIEFSLSVREAVLLGCLPRAASAAVWSQWSAEDEARAELAMKRVGCLELASRQVQTLSGGEAQLVSMARALAVGARVLLLDEAFSRMDLHHTAQMVRLIHDLKCEGYSFLFVSHDLNQALSISDRCLILKYGKVVQTGTLREAITPEVLSTLYPGVSVAISTDPDTQKPWIRLRS